MSEHAAGRAGPARSVLNPGEPDRRLRFEFDCGSNYEAETRVTAAFAALIPDEELLNPDHRFFQVVHLVSEHTWCQMHYELCRVCHALDADDLALAARLLDRTVGLAGVPVHCIRLMQDHLPQASFLHLRTRLMDNASGLDSPGGRNLRRVSMALWRSFEASLARHGVTHGDLVDEMARCGGPPPPEGVSALATIQAGLHALDCATMEWNQLHQRLVFSHLGGHSAARGAQSQGTDGADMSRGDPAEEPVSLRGAPISDLGRLAERSMFPRLWQEVDQTFQRIPRPTHYG